MILTEDELEAQIRWGESAKTRAENRLSLLAGSAAGRRAIDLRRGGVRVKNLRLETKLGGLKLENPLLVGPGWDKQGRCVDGLYQLGFAGTEVGSVTLFPQSGNPKPRMFFDRRSGTALNRFGFNSVGVHEVADNLLKQRGLGVVGLSIGKNKIMPDEYAPYNYAAAIAPLHEYADYFVICLSSPNTPGIRSLLSPKPLTGIVRAVQSEIKRLGKKPLFIKTVIDLSLPDLDKVLGVCIDQKVDGVIDTNTTIDEKLKEKYGWGGQAGGLSGNDDDYRRRANQRMRHITKALFGTNIARIGVGSVNDAPTAIARLQAGAQALEIVTAFWPLKPRLASQINRGILDYMDKNGVKNISELIGVDV